jgi:hypothetical protein
MRDGVSMYTFGSTSKERKYLLVKPKLMRTFPNNKKITGNKYLVLKSKITYKLKGKKVAHKPTLPNENLVFPTLCLRIYKSPTPLPDFLGLRTCKGSPLSRITCLVGLRL